MPGRKQEGSERGGKRGEVGEYGGGWAGEYKARRSPGDREQCRIKCVRV